MNAPIGSLRSPLPPLWRGKLRCHNSSLPRLTGKGDRASGGRGTKKRCYTPMSHSLRIAFCINCEKLILCSRASVSSHLGIVMLRRMVFVS